MFATYVVDEVDRWVRIVSKIVVSCGRFEAVHLSFRRIMTAIATDDISARLGLVGLSN